MKKKLSISFMYTIARVFLSLLCSSIRHKDAHLNFERRNCNIFEGLCIKSVSMDIDHAWRLKHFVYSTEDWSLLDYPCSLSFPFISRTYTPIVLNFLFTLCGCVWMCVVLRNSSCSWLMLQGIKASCRGNKYKLCWERERKKNENYFFFLIPLSCLRHI